MAFFLVPLILNFTIGMGISLLASKLAKKPKQKVPEHGNYPQQTSLKAIPIQKVYGTRRVAGNILWQTDVGTWDYQGVQMPVKSFLIGICEGPAVVRQFWMGMGAHSIDRDTRFSRGFGLANWYWFDGNGTGGYTWAPSPYGQSDVDLKTLTGEEFGDWPNLCMVFAQNVPLTSSAIPDYTFEVTSGYSDFGIFTGLSYAATYTDVVYKIKSDGTLDTSWATDGKFGADIKDYQGSNAVNKCNDILRLGDGSMLLVHNTYWHGDAFGEYLAAVTKVTPTGEIDTSWGIDGHYILAGSKVSYSYPMVTPHRILECHDGTFVLWGISNTGSPYNYHKISADGHNLIGRAWNVSPKLPYNGNACWYDEHKRILLIAGNSGNMPTSEINNTVALDVDTLEPYTGWGGALSHWPAAGYANVGPNPTGTTTKSAYDIMPTPDGTGFIVIHANCTDYGSDYTLAKINKEGTAYDTSWAYFGHAGLNLWPRFYTSNIGRGFAYDNSYNYVLGSYKSGAVADNTIQRLEVYDSGGNLINSQEWDSAYTDVYHNITSSGGMLYLATRNYAPAQNEIEKWTIGLNYRNGYTGVTNVYHNVIIPAIPQIVDITDANPSIVVKDLLINKRYGAGLDLSYIDEASFGIVESYCADKDILISLVLKDSRPVVDWVDHILAHCNGYRWWAGDKLKLGVFKDEDAVGDTLVASDLVVDDTPSPAPPLTVSVRERSETFNRVELAWTNRENLYDLSQVIAQDQVDQRVSGQVRIKSLDLDGLCTSSRAMTMVYRTLYESMNRFKILAFSVGYEHMLMEIGDVKNIQDGYIFTSPQKIRILSIEEEANGRRLSIEAVEERPELYGTISVEAQAAWTPQPISYGDDIAITDVVDIDITPVDLAVNETIAIDDYSNAGVV